MPKTLPTCAPGFLPPLQVTFKEIITQYRSQPQARSHTFRQVPLLQDAQLRPLRSGDIIAFYNTIIIPAAKEFLHALAAGSVPLATPPGGAVCRLQSVRPWQRTTCRRLLSRAFGGSVRIPRLEMAHRSSPQNRVFLHIHVRRILCVSPIAHSAAASRGGWRAAAVERGARADSLRARHTAAGRRGVVRGGQQRRSRAAGVVETDLLE